MIRVEHELHARRKGRNRGVFLLLTGLVAVVFGLTVVKILGLSDIRQFETFDHVARPALGPEAVRQADEAQSGAAGTEETQ